MNVFVYPPAHGFGMDTLFRAARAALPAQGVKWSLAGAVGAPPDAASDLAHLYSLPDVYTSFQNLVAAQDAGLRVVTTAIWWDPARLYTQGLALAELADAGPAAERAAALRALTQAAERALLRAIYRASDVLIAQSPSEAEALARAFEIEPARIVVAWVGAEPSLADASPARFQERYGVRDFVLCVGRVDPNKNQLSLVRALRNETLPLVLAGGSLAPPYLERCKAEAGANVLFLPSLSAEELTSAYAAGRVHALVSWLEVVGLVTLEAAVAGCNVVLTREHGARDYVGDKGWYCDSADVDSIRRAVRDAYNAPRTAALRDELLQNFTWDKHAAAVRQAYECAQARAPQRERAAAQNDLQQAVRALTALVPSLEAERAALWHAKSEAERTMKSYAQGRLMRALNTLNHFFKR